MGKGKGYNSSHVYCQTKGWSKRVKKIFSMIWKRFLKWYDGGEKMESYKKEFLKLKCFSPLKILTSLFI
jgi:hypothetical protein